MEQTEHSFYVTQLSSTGGAAVFVLSLDSLEKY